MSTDCRLHPICVTADVFVLVLAVLVKVIALVLILLLILGEKLLATTAFIQVLETNRRFFWMAMRFFLWRTQQRRMTRQYVQGWSGMRTPAWLHVMNYLVKHLHENSFQDVLIAALSTSTRLTHRWIHVLLTSHSRTVECIALPRHWFSEWYHRFRTSKEDSSPP